MTAFTLKLIAMATMFIDHLAASCFYGWGLNRVMVPGLNISVYLLGRIIGRMAFPIFCFQIAEGVRYTHSLKKYAVRLGVMCLISEPCFDFGLHRLALLPGQRSAGVTLLSSIDWHHQNVYFTLFFGMLLVAGARLSREVLYKARTEGKLQSTPLYIACMAVRYLVWGALTYAVGYVAKFVLHTDYGMGGVVMISMMGLINEPWEDLFPGVPRFIFNVAVCGAAFYTCCQILSGNVEKYGAVFLIFVALYNGKKGYTSKKFQTASYLFYPVHLVFLGFLKYFAA